jgi:hypothetical protein
MNAGNRGHGADATSARALKSRPIERTAAVLCLWPATTVRRGRSRRSAAREPARSPAAGAADVEREVELAAVVEAVVGSAERDDTVGVVAAAVLARDEVGWVDRGTVADDARELGDVGSLLR